MEYHLGHFIFINSAGGIKVVDNSTMFEQNFSLITLVVS
jgi:hypothetical protein